jgi:NADH:ubiquinone oxidoreductase subunit 2 (subunit N)
VLAALLIVGTAISLYAYAKVVRAMYASGKHHKTHDVRPLAPLAWVSAAICAVAVIAMTFYPITPSNVLPLVK